MRIFKYIRRFVVCGFVLLAVCLLAPVVSHGLTVTNLNNAGAGSLRQAVADTPAGGTVDFAVTGTIVLGSEIEIDKSLTIQGPGADMLTVSGGNTTRVFNVTGGTDVKINDIRIADGFVDDGNGTWGAAIFFGVSLVNLELNDCVVDNNTSAGGLGLGVISFVNTDISLVVNRCSFTNNSTTPTSGGLAGGGVFGAGAPNIFLEVNDSSFTNNLAQSDGALALGGVVGLVSSPLDYKFNNCTFDSNRVITTNGEGAIGGVLGDAAGDNTIKFTNCTFYNNLAQCSGEECTFALGGAIGSVGASDISCDFCTFAKNELFCLSDDCGFLGGDNLGAAQEPNISIANSIIDSDIPSDSCSEPIVSLGYNIDNGGSCVDGSVVGDKPNTNPQLDPAGLQNNGGPTETIALLPNSLAIDMANPACPPPGTDQRGVLRPQFTRCDIGAYEFQLEPRNIPTISEWGLIAMAGILGIVGFMVMRRRRAVA